MAGKEQRLKAEGLLCRLRRSVWDTQAGIFALDIPLPSAVH